MSQNYARQKLRITGKMKLQYREAASIHNVLTLKDNSRLVINGNVECITWILPGSQKLDMFDV